MYIQVPLKYQASLTGLVVISFNILVLRFVWYPLSSHATSSLVCLAVSAKFQVTDQATPSVSLEHGFAGLMDSALLTVLSTHQRRVCALWAFL